MGSRHHYSASSQDTSSRFVASALLYGNPAVVPMPDVVRTSFLLMLGANPLVSRGSVLSAGNLREKFNAIVERGGRVVVVDPRRTETARAYEHVAIRPDGDAWLLLAMLNVIFAEGLDDAARSRPSPPGWTMLREAARDLPAVESAETRLRHRCRARSATWPATSPQRRVRRRLRPDRHVPGQATRPSSTC